MNDRALADEATDSLQSRLFQAVCNNATVAIFLMDDRQHCVYMNPAAEKLTGYTLAEMRGRRLHDVVHHSGKDGRPYPLAEYPIERAFRHNTREHGEDLFVRPDGSRYPVAYTASPVREDGLIAGTIVEVRNISDGKRSQDLQLAQKQALELAASGAPLIDVLNVVVRAGAEQLEGRAAIFIVDANGAYLRFGAAAGIAGDEFSTSPQFPSCGRAALTGQRVVVRDVTQDPLWAPFLDLARRHEIGACWSTPIRSFDGEVLGTFAIYHRGARDPQPRDLEVIDSLAHTAAISIERHKAEEERRASEERHQLILESAAEYAIFTTGLSGRITTWNTGAQRLLGYAADEIIGRPCDVVFTTADRETGRPAEERRLALVEGRADNERWHQRKDGSRFWASGLVMPLKDRAGTVQGFLKILRDRTAERRDEERRSLLINELNHRVKNTLATVQSVVAQGLRGVASAEEVRSAIESRLMALSQSHDLLTRENWESANLRDVALQALEPYAEQHGHLMHFTIEGPDVRLPAKATLALGMAFHELATNAAKYGALLEEAGRIDLSWHFAPTDQGDRLRIEWRERGGPPVRTPSRKGFGSRLLERGLAHELDGHVRLDYVPEGVVCEIDMPAPDGRS